MKIRVYVCQKDTTRGILMVFAGIGASGSFEKKNSIWNISPTVEGAQAGLLGVDETTNANDSSPMHDRVPDLRSSCL